MPPPDFATLQNTYGKARKEVDETRLARFVMEQRLEKHKKKLRAGARLGADLSELEVEAETLAGNVKSLLEKEGLNRAVLLDQGILFEQFSNPVENIERLDDKYPIVMFPVRLETRFKSFQNPNGEIQNQLWLRVYPDDVLVDTFEALPAEVEVNNTRIYWINMWKAGGDIAKQKAAWGSLAKSHGSGRAHWLINTIIPVNLSDEPASGPDELILVIESQVHLSAAEKTAAATFWGSVFVAANDPGLLQTALDTLTLDVGASQAELIFKNYQPVNLTDPIAHPERINSIKIAFLDLPDLTEIDTQQNPWMSPARVNTLPERFVVMGYKNGEQTLMEVGKRIPPELLVSPIPTEDEADQLRIEDDELVMPEELNWISDFDDAINKGMGFKIDLSRSQVRFGFDRLFVLGVRLSEDQAESQKTLEELIQNHQRSSNGFAILQQGTPTNNVESEDSAYSWREDSELSFEHFFVQDQTDDPNGWRRRKDGRWMARALGINPDVLKQSPGYFSTDQCESRAMNEALWPTTLGYFMNNMMDPVFTEQTTKQVRDHFNRHVLGRGTTPAFNVGQQPYGILPVAPYSRLGWIFPRDNQNTTIGAAASRPVFLQRLYRLIRRADQTWRTLVDDVSYVGKPNMDPHQALLDVVGLHPSSVEFYQRYAESIEQFFNRLKLSGFGGIFLGLFVAGGYVQSGMNLLEELGYSRSEKQKIPEILTKLFLQSPNLLKGALIDDQDPSEISPIRAYRDDGTNYIQWLITAARDSHDTLRQQSGFTDNRPPSALLYLMLRHALDLQFIETSFDLHVQAGLMSGPEIAKYRAEPKFFHVEDVEERSANSWDLIYKADTAITGAQDLRIAEFIPQILTNRNPYLNQQISALEHIANAPTARLERVFSEHVDCCTNRLDAWYMSLLSVQLDRMREAQPDDTGASGTLGSTMPPSGQGCYLGAFGWLEDLKPENRQFEAVELDSELGEIFNKDPAAAPIQRDSQNFGYIHAPSLNHAVTAAVLRNGYLANATPENPEALAVNLSSERVRLALSVIEGMRNGQSLGALLGYYLERGLHDEPGLFLDSIIYELRQKFPLVANRFATTQDPDAAITNVEARNVVDGLSLVEHIQETGNASYPFGITSGLPVIADPNALAAIDAQVNRIRDINDAVADLSVAESVFQVVQGNSERAAGTLDAYSKGTFPPQPEVIKTPRSGITITHRVGIHMPADLNPASAALTTPRSKGEPGVNAWLESVLPPSSDIFCDVEYFNTATDSMDSLVVTAADIGLLPTDLLYMLNRDGKQDMKALDDLIVWHAMQRPDTLPDSDIKINFRAKLAGKFSFFEVAPLLANLKALITRSRPLQVTDTQMPNEAQNINNNVMEIRTDKIVTVRDMLQGRLTELETVAASLAAIFANPDTDIIATKAIDEVDTLIVSYADLVKHIALFGFPGAAIGFALSWQNKAFANLKTGLKEVLDRWQVNRDEFDLRIAEYATFDAAMPDEDKISFLLRAALQIDTRDITLPVSGLPDDLLTHLSTNLLSDFTAARANLEALLTSADTVGGLYKGFSAALADIALHDVVVPDLASDLSSIVNFVETLKTRTDSLAADITSRIAAANLGLTDIASLTPEKRSAQLTEAIRKLTSEDFAILPEFLAVDAHANEWKTAKDDLSQLLKFQRDDQNVDFPVDHWLYGVARVREKMHHLESAIMLSEAITLASLDITPLQFPFRPNDSWLALEFPENWPGTSDPFILDEEKLLYSAHYPAGFDPLTDNQCGILIDEWTEVIPAKTETTGLTFHYDRPNSEPPQTLLLAMPANFTGSWDWQDIVDSMHETLDMARLRAVEPQQLDKTPVARFLPAVLSKVTRFPVMSMMDMAFNNEVHLQTDGD